MRRWNGEYVIILLVSGIFSETNGFQKSDLRVSDHTQSSRPYSNQLIPWLRQLSGSIQKWFLLPSVSISALSIPSNTGVLSSVRYLISQKNGKIQGRLCQFSGDCQEISPLFFIALGFDQVIRNPQCFNLSIIAYYLITKISILNKIYLNF